MVQLVVRCLLGGGPITIGSTTHALFNSRNRQVSCPLAHLTMQVCHLSCLHDLLV